MDIEDQICPHAKKKKDFFFRKSKKKQPDNRGPDN